MSVKLIHKDSFQFTLPDLVKSSEYYRILGLLEIRQAKHNRSYAVIEEEFNALYTDEKLLAMKNQWLLTFPIPSQIKLFDFSFNRIKQTIHTNNSQKPIDVKYVKSDRVNIFMLDNNKNQIDLKENEVLSVTVKYWL
jgi:hypothetical protein